MVIDIRRKQAAEPGHAKGADASDRLSARTASTGDMSTASSKVRKWLGLAVRARSTLANVAFLYYKIDWFKLVAKMREAD